MITKELIRKWLDTLKAKPSQIDSKPRSFSTLDRSTNMPRNRLSVEMRVLVARPLCRDVYSDVGKTGTVLRQEGKWWFVALDGESLPVPFRETELDPLKSSKSHETV